MSAPPILVTRVHVAGVQRLSPSFTRIVFSGAGLAELGVEGPWFDQRIKLIVPPPGGPLPDLEGCGADWYAGWCGLPEHERGAMRTYSVRDVRGAGNERRLVVDIVLHLAPGAIGPAATWASRASIGDEVLVVGPRYGQPSGGIEFRPGDASRLLLVGDESAVPAIARILEDLPTDAVGDVLCEVPHAADVQDLRIPAGMTIRWLPRDGVEVGRLLIPNVLAHLGAAASGTALPDHEDDGAPVWETPSYSATGGDLTASGDGIPGLYAWIAGESRVVTTLRRHLVAEVGVDRKQVAFMGYWRRGVAMGG